MRDLHSHYLPGVDDGSKDLETTKKMLESASKHGITDIIFTPHYILDSKYMSTKQKNKEIFESIKKIALEEYNINIFLGNEVYCNTSILDLYKSGKISTLNDSRYMLIEIPLYSKMNNVKEIFFELIDAGIVPILAHPERYTGYFKDIEFFTSLREMGVLMQINYASLLGEYGTRAKKMAKLLLKNHLISFVGSDIHNTNNDLNEVSEKALKKLKKLVSEEEYIDLTTNNFARVVRDEVI